MQNRTFIQVVAAIVVAVYALGLWFSGVAVEAEWLRFYSLAVLVAAGGVFIWDKWAWRWSAFTKVGTVPPRLRGTWRGTLTSLWENPCSGAPPDPKPAYLVIRQTASTISARLFTDEGSSVSTIAKLRDEYGTCIFEYLYVNSPHPRFTDGSPMHHGSTMLTVSGEPPNRLSGRYWTDRYSRGELDFDAHTDDIADDFESAEKLFS